MESIRNLSKQIEEELHDAEKYAMCALKHRDDHPELAQTYSCLSSEEMHHVDILHKETVRIIEQYRQMRGEPPTAMKAVYDYLHEQQVERAKEVRLLQEQFNR